MAPDLVPWKAKKPQNPHDSPGAAGMAPDMAERAFDAVGQLARSVPGAGDAFHMDAARLLAEAFDCALVFVGLLVGDSTKRIETIAVWEGDRPGANFSYPLTGSPCADVLQHDGVFVASGVRSAYPQSAWLDERELESYCGVELDGSPERQGVVVIADTRPLSRDARLQQVLAVFATRLALELQREETALRLALTASVFERSPQGIMISDVEHRICRVNAAFSAITGWDEADVIGRRESMLGAGRDDPRLGEEIQSALDDGGTWVGELWSRRRDGEVFPENRTVVAVRDENRNLQHYVSMFSDISAEKFAAERIHRLAHYDATTELPNRVLLQDRLLHAINRAVRANGRLALLFLDLDGFKLINDTFGHAAGDELLRLVGLRLTSRLRRADIVARIGGDEFAVVLSDVSQDSDVQAICDQLLQVITEPYELGGEESRISTSIGIAMFPEDGDDVQTLLKHADAAMYQAKEAGKNRYAFYEPEMNRRAEERLHLTLQLRGALDRDEFRLCYQPQYDFATGRLVGVEALVRWRDREGVMIPPTRFIPIAEDSGLIVALGTWVMREACRQAQQWREQGLDFGRLAVNVSGRQFNDEQLHELVAQTLQETGLPGTLLELEITESWVMEGPFRAEKQMRLLNDMGVNLAIDDFGVANASMAYLKRFPVQKLKIDRSFVRDIPNDNDDAAIVSAIIAMGHSLGLRVVAEGVETAEQSAFLRGTGCDEVQGYLYGRPVPADEMNVLLLYSPTLSPA